MSKPGKPSVFKVTVLATLLATALGAQAAGLGKLTVYSGIGQPLNAEVALTATQAELNSLSARLAPHEAFKDAGIDFMPALSGLRFSVAKMPNGQAVLKLTSDRPLDEPFLHFLVELNWSSGRMMREYTFLLDPPELLRAAKPASVVAPAMPATTALPAGQVVQQKPVPPAAAKPRTESAAAGEYQVKRGDTLSKIAREVKSESVSLDQMLVALFDGNRDAFDGNNMNRLRSGKILRMPDPEQAAKVDPAAARKLVIGQAGEFNAYRRQLAEAAGAAPAVAESAPRQQVSGAIKPQVEERVPATPAKDKLEVSRTEPAKTAKTVGGSGLEEDLIARDKALREAADRIAQLETNIENLKRLVEIKSQAGAKLQQERQAAVPKPAEAQPAPVPQAEKPAEKPAAEIVAAKPAEAPVPAAEPAKPAEPVPAAAVTAPEKKPAAPPPPPPEPNFVEDNPELVYGGGGLLALLLGYFGYSSWRRKKQAALEEAHAEEPFAQDVRVSPVVAIASTEETANGEISIQSNFGESGALTAEEIVDPVAEADVLMAYGRDRQAEEILQEGMKTDPARTAIHMKLLELYSKQENLSQFETVATELHKQNNGRGAEWDKALSMAHALGLSGGVFIGAELAGAKAHETSVEAAEPVAVEETAVAAAPAAMPQPAEEAESLDFDLDLGTTSRPAEQPVSAAATEPVAAAPASNEASLDFDFDLGAPEAAATVETAGAESVTAAGAENDVDFSFDLDLGTSSGAGIAAEAAEAAEREAATAEAPAPLVASPEEAVAVESAGAGELKFDFDLELDGGSQVAGEETPGQDVAPGLADISLDLNEPAAEQQFSAESAAPQEVTVPVPTGSTEEVDFSLDLDAGQDAAATGGIEAMSETENPEVATKLELAQAYEEMGDLEGARELLNEVMNEGSAVQQAQARAKLDQLSV